MNAMTRPQETATVTRMTAEGRKLSYELKVIQQPERARACGSGAKSSADRRPVDPPPVVELKIYEIDAQNLKNDITFSYNANFFVFATLETARPIIHGRVQQTAQQIPVLTGMPVSGMAYLDRPTEAGYFIFPDLSVRHEGKYRLSFNLYEETKEDKDKDGESATDARPVIKQNPDEPTDSFDWRLEIKSEAFTVFSAKKFPGLAESTSLSRTVAEQGCRVRIRRDVRMRRREGKAADEYDERADANGYRRSTRSATPVEPYSRQRSLSNSNSEIKPEYAHRRPSADAYPPHPSYPAPYNHGPASTPQQGGSYLGFGGHSAQQPQFQTPQFAQPAPPPPAQPQQPHQSAQSPYHQQAPQYPPQQSPGGYSYPERPQYGQYQAPRDYDPEYRRQSLTSAPLPQPQYPREEQDSNHASSYAPYQSRTEAPVLAPIKISTTPAYEPKHELASSPIPSLPSHRLSLGSLPSPGDRPGSYMYPSLTSSTSAAEPQRAGSKRAFETVFANNAHTGSLHNGERPSSSHNGGPAQLDNEELTQQHKMEYRRAGGERLTRAVRDFE
ncbi:hypothetical protein V499_01197 [Pseudogymnoascus sp. VKM F-103]|uniref:Velvet protein n=1 Tax=Pseudogymnoascus verrucosus TaxID=342668 RepID=A0A1B8G6D6_9PEZI|nr:velvet protein [Pseudogymnoascus verrucosus]KFY79873.1 hypothetical protein V499_01197 [Pseudogymnoascus sp. VKM F-103]OBT91399.1 velvet protein [Pseudogymnoascus verrucosus]